MIEALNGIIAQLERQKTAIEQALAALRDIGGMKSPVASATEPVPTKSAVTSARDRRSEGQKKRWAAKKTAEATAAVAAPAAAPRKPRFSPAARKRLAEAMKRRWAAKRAAAAVSKTARKKSAVKAA